MHCSTPRRRSSSNRAVISTYLQAELVGTPRDLTIGTSIDTGDRGALWWSQRPLHPQLTGVAHPSAYRGGLTRGPAARLDPDRRTARWQEWFAVNDGTGDGDRPERAACRVARLLRIGQLGAARKHIYPARRRRHAQRKPPHLLPVGYVAKFLPLEKHLIRSQRRASILGQSR